MTEKRMTRRSVLAALAATAAGCSGQGGDPTTTRNTTRTATDTPTPTQEPTTTDELTPTEEDEPTTTEEPVDEREWPDEFYQGPMVSAHEHMVGFDGYSVIREDLDWFVDWMDRNRVDQVMAISGNNQLHRIQEEDLEDRFIPFAFGYNALRENLDNLDERFETRLRRHSGFEGIGEIGLKPSTTPGGESTEPIKATHPELMDLYEWAGERDLPFMLHGTSPWMYPDDGTQAAFEGPEDVPSFDHLAEAYSQNRDTEFLVHGTYNWEEMDDGEYVAQVLEEHPNLTYDMSGSPSLHPLAYGEGEFTEEEFLAEIEERGGVEAFADAVYEEHQEILENYSDRLTWGMDAALEWHYTDAVLDTWVDIGRAVLGKLPEEKARNVAYRTAEDLFDIDVPEDEY